jgi:Na+/H+-dicarboxylate symporter
MRSTSFAGKYLTKLYVQVLIAIVAGILLGHYMPDLGAQAKPLGDLFIKMIKMLLAPIIFASVAIGPMLLGAARPVQVLTPSATVRRIVNMTAVLVGDIASGQARTAA